MTAGLTPCTGESRSLASTGLLSRSRSPSTRKVTRLSPQSTITSQCWARTGGEASMSWIRCGTPAVRGRSSNAIPSPETGSLTECCRLLFRSQVACGGRECTLLRSNPIMLRDSIDVSFRLSNIVSWCSATTTKQLLSLNNIMSCLWHISFRLSWGVRSTLQSWLRSIRSAFCTNT